MLFQETVVKGIKRKTMRNIMRRSYKTWNMSDVDRTGRENNPSSVQSFYARALGSQKEEVIWGTKMKNLSI